MVPLVSPAWAAERMGDPGMVIVDATLPRPGVVPALDAQGTYLAAHLPGAVFFDLERLSDLSSPFPHMLPAAEQFARQAGELGIGDGMDIVVYEQGEVFSAPRAWWMLRTLGARNVFILDGGLAAWRVAGYPAEQGPVTPRAAVFHASLDRHAVMNFAQVQQLLAEHGQMLDARPAGRFSGSVPEPRPGIRSGHMPGSLNIPFTLLTTGNRMRSVEELRSLFQSMGVDLERPVATSCGSGVTAAVLALALELCGAKGVTVYDGSWSEYAQVPGAVIQGAH